MNKDHVEVREEPCKDLGEGHSKQRNSICKGPEVGVQLVGLRNSEKASVEVSGRR